jgi:hypothetical protein
MKQAIIYMMRNWKSLSAFIVISFIIIVFCVLSCGKKEPERPISPQKKVESPLPRPSEPPKKDVSEVKEEPETKKSREQIVKQDEKQVVSEKKEIHRKPKLPVITPAPNAKAEKLPSTVDFDRLNREFNSCGLNVWASEIRKNEILLNGYIKSERERRSALSIARRYNVNITDMINVVEVYSIEESESNRVHQPLPFSR